MPQAVRQLYGLPYQPLIVDASGRSHTLLGRVRWPLWAEGIDFV